MTTTVLRRLTWLVSVLSIMFWALIALRLMRDVENHVGWNVLYGTILFGAVAVLAGVNALVSRERWAPALLAYAALSELGVVLMYRYNVLVPYETWLERGMPSRPF